MKVTQGTKYTIHSKVTLSDGTELYGEVGEAVDMTELAGNYYKLDGEEDYLSVAEDAITFTAADQTVEDGYIHVTVYDATNTETDESTYVKIDGTINFNVGNGTGYIVGVDNGDGDSDSFAYHEKDSVDNNACTYTAGEEDLVIKKGYVQVTYGSGTVDSTSYTYSITGEGYVLYDATTINVELTINGLNASQSYTITFGGTGVTSNTTASVTTDATGIVDGLVRPVSLSTNSGNVNVTITGIQEILTRTPNLLC